MNIRSNIRRFIVLVTLLWVGMMPVIAQLYRVGDLFTAPDGSQGIVYWLNPDGSGGWVVALNDASTGCVWGEVGDIPGLDNQNPGSNNSQQLLYDTAGYAHTQAIRSYQNNATITAAGVVDFAHGWYLPSPAQLSILYRQLPFIEATLVAAGGTTLITNNYWCSAEVDGDNTWYVEFNYGYFGFTGKTSSNRVRAVRSFTYAPADGVTYAWSDGSTGSSITVLPSETATWSVTATNGSCEASDTVTVTGCATAVPSLYDGLVAYYPFDDDDLTDHTGNGNDGNNHGSTSTTDRFCREGKARNFAGVDNPQYIDVPNSSSLQFTDAATVSLWFCMNGKRGMDGWGYPAETGNNHYLFAKLWDSNKNMRTRVSVLNNGEFILASEITQSCAEDTLHGLQLGQWMQATIVYTTTYIETYVNGQLIARTDASNSFSSTNNQPLRFGMMGGNWYPMNGKLDDIRIFNRALNAGEVEQLYLLDIVPQDSLLVYLPLNGNVTDYSGNGFQPVLHGNVTPIAGHYGDDSTAYHFPGEADSWIEIPNDSRLNLCGSFTVSAWYNREVGWQHGNLVSKGRDISSGWKLGTSGININGSSGTNAQASSIPVDGYWHLTTSVYDAASNTLRYYLDGELEEEISGCGVPQSTNHPVAIGRHKTYADNSSDPWPYPFKGEIDDIVIYNRPLSADEVQALYAYNPHAVGCAEEEECLEPNNLTANNATSTSVDIGWTGTGDSYVVQYRRSSNPSSYIFEEGFESGIPSAWTIIDADGDGYQWEHNSVHFSQTTGHNGSQGFAMSASYDYNVGPLAPDNWLISPTVTLTANNTLTYYVTPQDESWPNEHWGVYISPSGGLSPQDFILLHEETLAADGVSEWTERNLDLSYYAGQTVRIAFRHFNCSDWFYLDLDDVNIHEDNEYGDNEWEMVSTNDPWLALTNLSPGTNYEYQVKTLCGNGVIESTWSEPGYFTTILTDGSPCPGHETVTDHEGNIYNTVKIGNQCWTKENMRCTTSPRGHLSAGGNNNSLYTPYYYDYASSTIPLAERGYLYNWAAAMDTTTMIGGSFANRRGICPQGWHIPSNDEWTEMVNYLAGISEYNCGEGGNIAKAVSSTMYWNTDSSDCTVGNQPNLNNATGFSAIPAGYYLESAFYSEGEFATFWLSTSYNGDMGYWYSPHFDSPNVNRGYWNKHLARSIRCLLGSSDEPTVTTGSVTSITATTASCSGSVNNDGGSEINTRGVCWSTSPNPTLNDSYTNDGTDTGTFTSTLTDLMPCTTYYVRAFARNWVGVGYGEEVTFTTESTTVTIDTLVCDSDLPLTWNGLSISEAGTYTATLQAVNGCDSMVTLTLNMLPSPTLTHASDTVVAPGDSATLWAFGASDLIWTNADGDTLGIGETLTVNPTETTTYYVTGITESGNLVVNGDFEEGNTGFTTEYNYINDGVYGHYYVGHENHEMWSWDTGDTLFDHTTGNGLWMMVDAYDSRNIWTQTVEVSPNTNYMFSAWFVTDNIANVRFEINDHQGEIFTTPQERGVWEKRQLQWNSGNNSTATLKITSGYATYGGNDFGIDDIAFFPVVCETTEAITVTVSGIPAGDAQPCPGHETVTDYDGNVYNTVKIGEQCWMKENLRVTHYEDGMWIPEGNDSSSTVAYRYAPNNNYNNVPSYGYLYNWAAVMHGANSSTSNPSGVQGICPTGWHVPSYAEWTQLTYYVNSVPAYLCDENANYITKALASTTGWQPSSNNCSIGNDQNANNATGFSALPAGYYAPSNFGINRFSTYSYLWASTEYDNIYTYNFTLCYSDLIIWGLGQSRKYVGNSVRCVLGNGCLTSVTEFSDTICTGSSYAWNDSVYTESGDYTQMFTNAAGCDSVVTLHLTITDCIPAGDAQPCPGHETVTDYDGNVYNTVKIGEQCWMKENLRVTHYVDAMEIPVGNGVRSHDDPYCYAANGNDNIVSTYGRLYNYPAVMHGVPSSSANPSGVQGVCPTGWHLPSSAEWDQLINYVSNTPAYACESSNSIAKALSATQDWYTSTNACAVGNDLSANNSTGFSALPTGYLNGYTQFDQYHQATYFRSTNEYNSTRAHFRHLYFDSDTIYIGEQNFKSDGMSVRCVLGDGYNLPAVATTGAKQTGNTTAYCNGNVTYDGNTDIIDRGICWSTSQNPTLNDNVSSAGAGTGDFAAELANLEMGNTYYLRTYATNNLGTSYGEEVELTMHLVVPKSGTETYEMGYGEAITVYDHGGPDANYDDYCDGILVLHAPTDKIFVINGSYYTENCCDVLSMYDGEVGTNQLATLRGGMSTIDQPLSTTQNTLSLHFTSDYSVTYSGFALQINLADPCDNPNIYQTTFDTAVCFSELPFTWHGHTFTAAESYTETLQAANGCDSVVTLHLIVTSCIPAGDAQPCPGHETVTDYDGNVYNTVKIGEQCWMKENLRVTHYEDGTDVPAGSYATSNTVPYYYDYSSSGIALTQRGYLYNWQAAMHGDASSNSNPSNVQGVCPNGWHLPSDTEWSQLKNYVSSLSEYTCGFGIAKALASTEGWITNTNGCAVGNNQASNNASGFSAVPAGYFSNSSYYTNANYITCFWSSSQSETTDYALSCDLYYSSWDMGMGGSYKHNGFSVRCVLGDGCLSSATEFSATACESYTWNGQTYTESGDYTQTFTNAAGCDSAVTLHLTINSPTHLSFTETACESFEWRGVTLTESGTYTYEYLNSDDCTGADTLHLTILNPTHLSFTETAYDSYTWTSGSGETYTQSGTYYYSHTDANGCTQVDTLHLTVYYSSANEFSATVCESYEWDGEIYTQSGNYTRVYHDIHGADSTVTLHLTVYPLPVISTVTASTSTICQGSHVTFTAAGDANAASYIWYQDGVEIPGEHQASLTANFYEPGNYSYSVKAISLAGCESGLPVEPPTVTVAPSYSVEVSGYGDVCDGGSTTLTATVNNALDGDVLSYQWYRVSDGVSTAIYGANSATYTTSDQLSAGDYDYYVVVSGSYAGCSAISSYVPVNVFSAADTVTLATICDGDSYNFFGQNLTTAGTYTHTLQTVHGCDSVVTLMLIVNPTFNTTLEAEICQGESYSFFGQNLTTAGNYSHTLETVFGCDSVITLTLTVNPSFNTQISAEICQGESYSFFGQNLTTAGTYTHTLQTVHGCDSVITLTLTVHTLPSVSISGNSSISYGQNITLTSSGANSFVWSTGATTASITVSPTTTTTYSVTGTNQYGCTATASKTVTVNPVVPTITTNSVTDVGTNSATTGGNVSSTGGADVTVRGVCYSTSPNPTVNNSHTTDGSGTGSFISSLSNLTPNTTYYVRAYASNSAGTAYGNEVSFTTSCNTPPVSISGSSTVDYGQSVSLTAYGASSYTWSTGSHAAVITVSPTSTTTYFVTGTNQYGCTATASKTVTVNPVVPTVTTNNVSNISINSATGGGNVTSHGGAAVTSRGICWSTSHNPTVNDAHYNNGGGTGSFSSSISGLQQNTTYYVRAFATNSVGTAYGNEVSFTTLCTANATEFSQTACGSYTWNGQTYTQSGDYTQYLANAYGCDSVVTMHLTVNYVVTSTRSVTACDSYTWNELTYTQSGDYTQTFTAANGCDSIVIMHLTVNQSSSSQFSLPACDSYTWNGQTYTESGDYIQTFTAANGCDSIVTMHLTVNHSSTSELEETVCDEYSWNGHTYTESGDYIQTYFNSVGCDSVVTLHLTVNYSSTSEFADTACDNESYVWNGQTYTESGDYVQTLTTVDGCDSVVTLHLTMNGCSPDILVYPNPASTTLHIHLPDPAILEDDNYIYAIMHDPAGHLVLKERLYTQDTVLDIYMLRNGLYLLEVNINGVTQKAFKQLIVNGK